MSPVTRLAPMLRVSAACRGGSQRVDARIALNFRARAGSEKTRRTLDQPIAIG
jgi:hypothetical protein